MLARALLHTSLALWMTGLSLQGGVRPQVSALGRLGIPVKDASLAMGGAKPASYSALGALGARAYGAKLGKVAGRYPGAHLGGGYRGPGAGRAALKQGAGYGAYGTYGVGLGTGMGMPLGAGMGNAMGLGLPHAGKRGVYGNGYGSQPGYGVGAGVGYAGVRPGLGAHFFPGQSAKGPKPGWPAAYLGGFGGAGGGQGAQNVRGGTLTGRGAMEHQGPVTSLRALLPHAPKVKGRAHVSGAAHHLHGGGGGGGGGGGLWTHQPPPGEQVKRLDPVGQPPHGATGPLAERLVRAASPAQAGTAFGFKDKTTLASSAGGAGGAGPLRHHQLPFSIERNQGLGLPVPPQAQGSSGYGSSPHLHRGPQNPGYHERTGSGTTALVAAAAAAGKQSKPPGGQVLLSPDGQRPFTPLGQEEQNYGLSYANSHTSSGYYGMAFEQAQRNHNYGAAATDKKAFKARMAAGESPSLLGLLPPGGPGAAAPEAGGPVSRDPAGRPLSVDTAGVRTDQGLVAGGGQVANGFSHVDPMLTTGSTRLAPPGLKEKRKQGPYMGYGAGIYPGGALGAAGYGAGLGQGGYPMAAGAGKLGGAGNLGHGGYPQGGLGKPTEFGDGTGAYGAGGLGAGNGYGYGNGYNMGGNSYGPGYGAGGYAGQGQGSFGGAGSVPVGAGVYGDAQTMGLGSDSGMGGGVGHLSNGAAPLIPAGLEGDGSYPYGAQLALGAEAAAAKSASKFGVGAGYGAQQAGFAAQAGAGQDSYGVPPGKYGVNGFLGNGFKG